MGYPPVLAPTLVRRLLPLLGRYPTATIGEKTAIWHSFLDFPGERLAPPRPGRQRKRTQDIKKSLDQQSTRTPEQVADDEAVDVDETVRAIRRASSLAKAHHFGKAARTLDKISYSSTLSRTETAAALSALHPSRADTPFPTCPGLLPEPLAITVPSLAKIVRLRCRAAAPGPSGWTEELLEVLLADADTATPLAKMLTDIANGEVASCVARRLRASRLVPIPKKQKGLRPVAVGEVFVRVVGALLLESLSDYIKILLPLQFGCMAENGCEQIVHDLRRFLSSAGIANASFLTIDCVNAFNSISRAEIARILYRDPKLRPLWAIFDMLYSVPGELLTKTKTADGLLNQTFLSQEGTRQGDPLAGFFFCLALQPLLMELRADYPAVRTLAYMDDVTMYSSSTLDLARAFLHFEIGAAKIGLKINFSKCELYGPEDNPAISGRGVPYNPFGIKVLGAFISHNPEAEKEFLRRLMDKHKCLAERLSQMPFEIAYPIAEKCFVPRMGYYLRTHHPESSEQAADFFDELILDIVMKKMGVSTLTSNELFQLHLPRRHGGFGLMSARLIATIAWECARTSTDASCTPKDQHTETEMLAREIVGYLPPRLRKALAERAKDSAWMDACLLKEHDFTSAMRSRLGRFGTMSNVRRCCPGCRTPFEGLSLVEHLLRCARVPGYNASTRHCNTAAFFVSLAYERGLPIQREPRDYRRINKKRECGPDFAFYSDMSERTVVDLTFVGRSSTRDVSQREKGKIATYGDQAAKAHEKFIPAVMSIFGHASSKTRQLLYDMAGIDESTDDSSRASFRQDRLLRAELSSTVQRENAHIMANCMRRLLPPPPSTPFQAPKISPEEMANEDSEAEDTKGGNDETSSNDNDGSEEHEDLPATTITEQQPPASQDGAETWPTQTPQPILNTRCQDSIVLTDFQKNVIAERLYDYIDDRQPEHSAKITAMLLELDNSHLLHLVDSPTALDEKISDAVDVLNSHIVRNTPQTQDDAKTWPTQSQPTRSSSNQPINTIQPTNTIHPINTIQPTNTTNTTNTNQPTTNTNNTTTNQPTNTTTTTNTTNQPSNTNTIFLERVLRAHTHELPSKRKLAGKKNTHNKSSTNHKFSDDKRAVDHQTCDLPDLFSEFQDLSHQVPGA